MKGLTHFSLCSGIGGLDLAAEWAGFETIAQCEIDDYASIVLANRFRGVPNLHDIRTVTNDRLAECGIKAEDITVVSAGFPCQPYSLAGKGLGDSDERDLWGEVARVLKEIRPRWFVGENTPGLFARQNQRYFRRVLDDLTALGYSVGWGIWGACDVGAPHKRDRVFLIAYRNLSDTNGSGQQECGIQQKPSIQSTQIHSVVSNSRSKRQIERRNGELSAVAEAESQWNNYRGRTEKYVGGEWWKTEPDVGRSFDGLSEILDGIGGISNEAKNRAYKILSNLQEAIGTQTILQEIGRYEPIYKSKILLSFLCEYEEECNESGVTVESRTITKEQMRDMWESAKSTRTSYRRQYKQQYAREYSNALQELSRKTSSSYATTWQDGSWESGIERISNKSIDRVDRLRCLGNAVVPQQAYPIFEAIAEFELSKGEQI